MINAAKSSVTPLSGSESSSDGGRFDSPLPSPRELRSRLPASSELSSLVSDSRAAIARILTREDPRRVALIGPCSIHDPDAALEFARRLAGLELRVRDTLFPVMRVYLEKPRTSVGWTGFLKDPNLDGSNRLDEGLVRSRELLLAIGRLGVPCGVEVLDPWVTSYLGDLVSWSAIGARTVLSQLHREIASGLPTPVGFKNSPEGDIASAVNAVTCASLPCTIIAPSDDGLPMVTRTLGNPSCHVILRGGIEPNFDRRSVARCEELLLAAGHSPRIMIDCSHGNSAKDAGRQPAVLESVCDQIVEGADSIIGFMLESNLEYGNQPLRGPRRRGVSVTDSCLGWNESEAALIEAHQRLSRGSR